MHKYTCFDINNYCLNKLCEYSVFFVICLGYDISHSAMHVHVHVFWPFKIYKSPGGRPIACYISYFE